MSVSAQKKKVELLLGDLIITGDIPDSVNTVPLVNVTIPANFCMIVARKYTLGDGIKLKLGDGSIFRMI